MKLFYILMASAVVSLYAVEAITGWEFGNPRRTVVSEHDRRSPGWSHSSTGHHFWFSGYRGGK